MVTETELLALGFDSPEPDAEETILFSPGGTVAIYMDEKDGIPKYTIAIYRDCIDAEGYYAADPAYTFDKDHSLTSEQLIQFTSFIEQEQKSA